MATKNVLAVDLGNESGRVVNIAFDGEKITARTRYRFMNHPVTVSGVLQWDVLNFFQQIQDGIIHATQETQVAGVGVASFGVDFGLLDTRDRLIANPVHMRDSRTDGILERVHAQISEKDLFQRTGIGSHPINTLFQLASLVRDNDWQLQHAQTLLTMPNLINFWLTGEKLSEFTHSTTTQCYSPAAGTWDTALLKQLNIPAHIFPQIVKPGECIGTYRDVPVYTVASHDTASAVVAVPTETPNYAYCSSGTWSLFGLEVAAPITSDAALAAGVTNEGGYGGSYRMLSLIMGMWLVQECRRKWHMGDATADYAIIFDVSAAEPFRSLMNPDNPLFFTPGDMPERIQQVCRETGEPVPQTRPEIVRCIMESLALKYDHVLRQQIAASGQSVDVIHVVGGGAKNKLLCQMTANATGIPVEAGPVEATAIGNGLVQLIATGDIANLAEARAVVRRSYPVKRYEPQDTEKWAAARERFARLLAVE